MKITACDCRAEHYRRVRRSGWMRALFPSRRLYHCLGCDETLFIHPARAAGSPFGDTLPQGPGGQEEVPRHSVA